jgi:hypothetical protein
MAVARDALVLKLKDCRYLKGFILAADEDITFLSDKGEISKVKEEEISLILTYGISESPFSSTKDFSRDLLGYIKEINLSNEDTSIKGFPFQYIEDLIFVMGVDGKMYVVSLGEIVSIKNISGSSKIHLNNSKRYYFDYNDYTTGCGQSYEKGKTALRPIRVLGDRIKVGEFVDSFRKGYRTFVDLQERTLFYAKPYLYPKRNRLGILQIESKKKALPFYYQWSTGEEFHFQSVNRFGGMISPYLPTFESNSVFSSEFKSHFFHGYFEGNIMGLAAGSKPQDNALGAPKTSTILPNYNYLAFMGADWKKFSFSYGGGYFTPYLQLKKSEKRQLTANNLSTALKVVYMGDFIKVKGLAYFVDDSSSSSFDIDDQIDISSSTVSSVDSYRFIANYYRAGIEFDFADNISFGGDYIIGKGDYSEKGNWINTIEFDVNQYMFHLKKQFGHYITLKLIMKASVTEMKTDIANVKEDDEVDETFYGGVFELLF